MTQHLETATDFIPDQSTAVGRWAWLRAGIGVAAVGWGANQFAPLLLVYRSQLGLSATTVEATFGLYALGLIPGLLVCGPLSDRFGRRAVMLPALVASVLASVLLIGGGSGVGLLFVGRLVAGVASGAAFSSGAAWIKELSALAGTGSSSSGPRRVTALAFTAVVTMLTALAGILVQPLARRIDVPGSGRLIGASLALVVAGLLVAAMAAATGQPAIVVVATLVLGAGYGACQFCGLQEIQRLAQPESLAGLTAVYQAVSYLGFALPFVLAAAVHVAPAGMLLLVVAGLAMITLAWTVRRARATPADPVDRIQPATGTDDPPPAAASSSVHCIREVSS